MAVSQADAASSAANAIVGEGGLIPEQRPHVCVVKDGGVARLPFPSCLSRTIAKLGAKPCQHPGLVDETFNGPGVEVAIAYNVALMQLIVSGAAVGTELNEIHLDNENVERYLSVPIQHAPYCPAAALDDMKPLAAVATDAASSRAIRAAVSILVINNEGKVLLTRRGKTMRAFPGFWVLPGGHVDPNERLCEAAAREISEETGLEVSSAEARVLCAWESCFPILLEHGPPKVQHVVLYFIAPLRGGSLRMQPVEVDSYAWLDMDQVRRLCRKNFEAGDKVEAMHSEEGGLGSRMRVEVSEIANNMAEGTRYALSRWCTQEGA